MKINKQLFDTLLSQAADSVRLRQNYDLRTSSEDQSQRMLNAVLPGTQVPIHRHQQTTECVFILQGKLEEILYDEKGVEYERYYLDADSVCRGCVVPKGVWHTIVVREPSVIFEAKDGVFKPLTSDDVWSYE